MILLTCIIKDDSEIEMTKRMLDSFLPHMQGLALVLTGTSQEFTQTKRLLGEYKDKYKNIEYITTSPETHPKIYEDGKFANFAEARNVSFGLASEMQIKTNYKWWSWADVDDILIEGKELKKAAKAKEDSVFFSYWYAVRVGKDGNVEEVIIDHLRERLLKPNLYKWISRLHEVTVPIDENYKPTQSHYDINPEEGRHCVWVHLPGEERSRNNLQRNIAILNIQLKEQDGKDPRTRFYLGKTYMDLATEQKDPSLLDKAVKELKTYLKTSGWAEERANAWEMLGNIHDTKGEHFEAIKAYHTAIEEHPTHHIPYLRLAKKYSDIGKFEESNHWLEVALKMPPPKARTTIGNPLEIKLNASQLQYNRSLREQNLKDAIYWLKMSHNLAGMKDDGMVKSLEEAKEMNDAGMWIFNYAKWLKKNKHFKEIKHVLDAIAPEFKDEQFVQHIANEVQEPKKVKGIVYFAGPTFEPWDDLSMKTGLGGSETAIVMLSKEWAKTREVTVYCDTENKGKRDGVIYKHWTSFNWNDEFETLIIWRNPSILDRKIKAKNLYYDAHDIESQTNWTEDRMKRIDKVFFKSNWHRSHVPDLPDSKAMVISNGIL